MPGAYGHVHRNMGAITRSSSFLLVLCTLMYLWRGDCDREGWSQGDMGGNDSIEFSWGMRVIREK